MQRLIGHVKGEVELTSTQIAAARILLAKTVPDLQSVDIGNKEDKPFLFKGRSDQDLT